MTSARMGGGPARFVGPDLDATTSSYQGTLRVGYYDEATTLIAGLDGTAYRLNPSSSAKINAAIDGNNLSLFVGSFIPPWALWISGGGGQLRSYTRPERKDDPLHYATTEWQIGSSYDFYRAAYGKIEGCVVWRRLIPDHEWRELYQVARIDAWQFELGFKFLDW